jgi:hypothetical protein
MLAFALYSTQQMLMLKQDYFRVLRDVGSRTERTLKPEAKCWILLLEGSQAMPGRPSDKDNNSEDIKVVNSDGLITETEEFLFTC